MLSDQCFMNFYITCIHEWFPQKQKWPTRFSKESIRVIKQKHRNLVYGLVRHEHKRNFTNQNDYMYMVFLPFWVEFEFRQEKTFSYHVHWSSFQLPLFVKPPQIQLVRVYLICLYTIPLILFFYTSYIFRWSDIFQIILT